MKDLIKISYLSKDEINDIINLAAKYKAYDKHNFTGLSKIYARISAKISDFSKSHAALMFFENSTRTRFSFECALNKLKAHSYVFDNSKSSSSKGENYFDTINNLAAIGINTFIIRTTEENFIDDLRKYNFYKPISFINAGEGKAAHPTQALLDYFTMKEKIGDVSGKKIVIIGDIKHSRVAKSNIALLSKMGANIITCAPSYFAEEIEGAAFVENLTDAIKDADVVMCLRIQNERLNEAISKEDFIKRYQITEENLPKNAILMHPGPVNRDVEIKSTLLDSPAGETILQQAQNGVYVRMAVLDKIFSSGGAK